MTVPPTHDLVPIEHPRHDIAWLRRYALSSALATALVAALCLAFGIVTGDAALVGVAFVMAAFTGWLMLTRHLAVRGGEAACVARMGIGTFTAMVLLLPLVPAVAATVAMASLIPVFTAVPYLGRRELQRYSLGAWAFSVAYVLVASLILVARGAGVSTDQFLDIAGTTIIVGFVVALIRRYALADEDVRFMALHDGLTGLYNRALFVDRLEHAIAREERQPSTTAVVYLDLDSFKAVNDRRGHAYGDTVLRAVANRLKATVRAGDTIARVGGDEFAVLLEDVAGRAEASALADRLRRATADPMALPDGESFHPLERRRRLQWRWR